MPLSRNANSLLKLANFQTKLLKKQDQWLAAHGISFNERTKAFMELLTEGQRTALHELSETRI